MRGLLLIVMLMTALMSFAGDTLVAHACDTLVARDTLVAQARDTLTMEQPGIAAPLPSSEPKKKGWLARLVDSFSDQDTAYVEPQHYNWALMLQSVTTFDYYRLSTTGRDGQSITFAPQTDIRMGPYFGWRWIFLGYTIDLRNLNIFSKTPRIELDASIYSARFGADIFYRRTVNNYKIRSADMGKGIDTRELEGVAFDGLEVSITGLNLYYIFNYRHFSYPAAFAQSSCQKISCGTWMAGLGYNTHHIAFDYRRMEELAKEKLGRDVQLDSAFNFEKVKYRNINASVGYAYNWVFARNWLLSSSLSLALAYKNSYSEDESERAEGFNFGNFNIDGIGRFALVWNNTRWYGGVSAIVRAYNYHKSRFATNNIFGDLSIYFGFNFGPRGPYKKKK